MIALLLFLTLPAYGETVWTESSFEDFVDGAFMDAGSNLYVSESGRLQIVNRWDFNDDGHLDILLPAGHGHREKEDSFVYYNAGNGDVDARSIERIPTRGGADGEIADLNRDGWTDLTICNQNDGVTDFTDTYIYWGRDGGGFSAQRRTILPSISARRVFARDFNGDGWIDLFILCRWQEDYLDNIGPATSLIYWNSIDGFDPKRRSDVWVEGSPFETAACRDLDGDGRPDILLSVGPRLFVLTGIDASEERLTPLRIGEVEESIVFLEAADLDGDGAPEAVLITKSGVAIHPIRQGALAEPASRLETSNLSGAAIADLDGDGVQDLALARRQGDDGAAWVSSSVHFLDAQLQFDANRMTHLPTMGARFVTAGDVDGDGLPDLLFSNGNLTNQLDLPSMLYWNHDGEFDSRRVTLLETSGSVANDIGDLNGDGRSDVVFFNLEGGFRDGASTSKVYWGDGSRDYGTERSVDIPSHYMNSCAHADLDDDGYVDLLMAQERFVSGADERIFNPLVIHWGSPDGFLKKTNLTVDSMGGGIRVLDLNRDGRLDIFVGGNSRNWGETGPIGATVFLGGPGGFSNRNRTLLPTDGESTYRVPLLADFDRDGFLDAAYQTRDGTVTLRRGLPSGESFFAEETTDLVLDDASFFGYLNCADFNRDGWLDLLLPVRKRGRHVETPSYILYGGPEGFDLESRVELPGYACTDPSVSDLNRDGWLDVVLHSYKTNDRRNAPTFIYYGGAGGFSAANRKELPSWGSGGVETADYDGDGWVDVLISNHCRDLSGGVDGPSTSLLDSFLYWNGPSGFSPGDRTQLFAIGPHAMNVRDVGNHYDRGTHEDYISSVFVIPENETPTSLTWEAATPGGTSVSFQVRHAASPDELESAHWSGSEGPDSWYDHPGAIPDVAQTGGIFQYLARLDSANGGRTPLLTSVTIRFSDRRSASVESSR